MSKSTPKQSFAQQDPVMDTARAAAYLTISERTLRRWRYDYPDRIPCVKIGNKIVRYRKSALDAFLLACNADNGMDAPGGLS